MTHVVFLTILVSSIASSCMGLESALRGGRKREKAELEWDFRMPARRAMDDEASSLVGNQEKSTPFNQSLLAWSDASNTVNDRAICNHHLSGVDDATVQAALRRVAVNSFAAPPAAPHYRLSTLRQQRIFIAVCLHNSAAILPQFTKELVRLLLALRTPSNSHNFFVSVYESGSTDLTPYLLHELTHTLNFMSIPNSVVVGGILRGHRERIDFLADIRNRAMDPIRNSKITYDSVLWMSDNLFCADGVLQMLAHGLPVESGGIGADAVCGMDWGYNENIWHRGCVFYDIWASHDITGHNFKNTGAIAGPSTPLLNALVPFQVFSCWNAQTVFRADLFQSKNLRFRTNRFGECPLAETELIMRDMWSIGRGKIAVSPRNAAAYKDLDFLRCAMHQQPLTFDVVPPMVWFPEPLQKTCCPLHRGHDYVDFGDCYPEYHHLR